MKLRSNLQPGTTAWAVRRAQWRALGLSDEDMQKPKIGVINSSSEVSACFSHLDEVARRVKEGIRAAGGLAFEFKTSAPSDFIHCAGRAGRYILPSRDLMVNDIEVAIEGPLLDGMVCLSSCDKTAPAHLMAAARLDVPSLIVIGGYQACGRQAEGDVDIEDVFEAVGKLTTGEIDLPTLTAMCDEAIKSPGVCAGMGTANSMHIMCEALGMTLPGSAPIAAFSPRLHELAEESGRRIVEIVLADRRPSSILTEAAFRNAVTVALAVSTSINVMRHLQAVAEEGDYGIDVYRLFEEQGRTTPLLAAIKPNGKHSIKELDAAGGTRALMKRLRPAIAGDARTVTGDTIAQRLDDFAAPHSPVIASLDAPVAGGPSLMILRGSLATDGAIMKLGQQSPEQNRFAGPAKVFDSQEDALAALAAGAIVPGQVIVLRGLGARGGPGVASASWFAAALNGSALGAHVAMVTDGQLSGLNRGTVVGQVMPEAAEGGTIALVRDGDRIVIDTANRRVDLEVPAEELDRRAAEAPPFVPKERKGWLALYQNSVQPLSRGGVLKPSR